jgi:hypothetical protein
MKLFIKYPDSKRGLRIVIEPAKVAGIITGSFYFEYDTLPKKGDEIFDGNLYSPKGQALLELPKRMGELWFMHLFQQLFHYHARHARRKRRKTK